MSEAHKNYVVLTRSGKVWNTKALPLYHSILDAVYVEYMGAGSNWDRPEMLIYNGKVVVERGLADVAWNYGKAYIAARTEAADRVNAQFLASWEPKAAGIPVREG